MTPTLIVTRPEEQGAAFAKAVKARWDGPLRVIMAPLMAIVPCDADPGRPDALIFTSAHGVAAAMRFGLPAGLPAWCVGTRTAELAHAAGFLPKTGPGDAEGLLADIIAAHPTGTLAHIRGRHSRGQISKKLQDAGISCADVVAYDQAAQPLPTEAREALMGHDPVVVPLFSPRTAEIFAAEGTFSAPLTLIAISAAAADALGDDLQGHTMVADTPDADAMVDAVVAALGRLPQAN